MAKTLSTTLRDAMLGEVPTNVNYIELVNNADGGTREIDMGAHAITWQAASGGSIIQDGTISFTFSLNDQDQSTNITGFRGYVGISGDSGTTQVMEGEFATSSTVQLDGTEYTINVSGITITLPESGA